MNNIPEGLDKQLLNLAQKEVPLVPQPFVAIANELGITEDDVIERLRTGATTKVSSDRSRRSSTRASSATDRCSSRCASLPTGSTKPPRSSTRIPACRTTTSATTSSTCGSRVAVPPGMSLEAHIDALHELTGAEATRMLPTLKMFKIEVRLDMETGVSNSDGPPPPKVEIPRAHRRRHPRDPRTAAGHAARVSSVRSRSAKASA